MTTRTLTALALSVSLFGIAQAAPPGKGVYQSTNKAEQISSMKPGDRYALVCLDCKTATVAEITDEAEAEKLCHDGGTIHCDSCEKDVTIKRVGPKGKQTAAGVDVKYLNSEGEECMVLIPLKE